jgi:pseudouridine synthase
MPHLRRREADAAVSSGRVRVNGALVKPSRRCVGGDVVTLDGAVMDWEGFADACEAELDSEPGSELDGFVYLKYHKPRGVTCTMEPSQKSSVLYALKDELEALRALRRGGGGGGGGGGGSPPRRSRPGSGSIRVFPVGRLDRDSSGLVLLTDDGRVPEALLDPDRKAPKVYDVDIDREVSDEQIRRLRAGVVITTTQQRGGASSTAATAPCEVRRIAPNETAFSRAALRFTLREGRNRQIRKMCEAVGVEVTRLHRVSTADVTLFLGEGESLLETGGLRRVEGDELRSLASAVSESLAKKRREGSDSGKPRVEAKEGWGTRIRDEASGRHG